MGELILLLALIILITDWKNNIEIFSNNGSEIQNFNFYSWIKHLVDMNIGEIMIQCIDKDGTGNGLDENIEAKKLSDISVPIIMMGGIGNFEQLLNGFKLEYVDAIATANLLNFIGNSFLEARKFLINKNINVPYWNAEEFNILENYFK